MEQATSGSLAPFFVALALQTAIFALGLVVGWLLGKARRLQALAIFVVGGAAVFAGYLWLIHWEAEPELKVEIVRPTPAK